MKPTNKRWLTLALAGWCALSGWAVLAQTPPPEAPAPAPAASKPSERDYRNNPYDRDDGRAMKLMKELQEDKAERKRAIAEGHPAEKFLPQELVTGSENLYREIGAYCGKPQWTTWDDYDVQECVFYCQRGDGQARDVVGRIGIQMERDWYTKDDIYDAVLVWYPILDDVEVAEIEAEKNIFKGLISAAEIETETGWLKGLIYPTNIKDNPGQGWPGTTTVSAYNLPLMYVKLASRNSSWWSLLFGSDSRANLFEAAVYAPDLTSDVWGGMQNYYKKETVRTLLARGLAKIADLDPEKEIGANNRGLGIRPDLKNRPLQYNNYTNGDFIQDLEFERNRWIRGFAATCRIAAHKGEQR